MPVASYLLEHFDQQDQGLPLYDRLADLLRHGIKTGRLGDVEILPSERELANLLAVSRVTVRKSINLLVSEGLLVQKQGSGTYIAKRFEQGLQSLTSFTEDMQKRGLSSAVVWLGRSTQIASPEECAALNLATDAQVTRLYRLRTANEEPLALELAVLPASLVPDPYQVQGSLYDYLQGIGHRPVRAKQRLRAVACDAEQATFLRIAIGSPVLYIERNSYLADGSPVEFTRSYYRGDSYDFISELSLPAI